MSASQDKLAVLFPGQGSQEPGMGRDLAEADSDVAELWKKAEKACGGKLREIFWDGDESDIADTRWLQPAMTVVNLGLWLKAKSRLAPDFFAGHSLGEYAALAASRCLSLDDTLELVSLRGRLMAEADSEGAMAAVLKLPEEKVDEIVVSAIAETGGELVIANYNSPGQYVISGHRHAVEAADGLVRETKGRAVVLPVSGAFHTRLMAEPARELARHMEKIDWRTPFAPVVLNVTGAPTTNPDEIREHMAVQMTSSVLWMSSLNAMWNRGARLFVELGPRGVLTRLLKANFRNHEDEWTGANYATAADLESL